ncbi:MAG: type III polyketide synthase [Rhodoglobus sp.]
MTRIAAVAPVLPDNKYSQTTMTAELAPLISKEPGRRELLERLHAASGIDTRHTALPIERYRSLGTFRDSNDIFIEIATELAERALRAALAACGRDACDIDFLMFTSVTGVAAPSVDALLMERLGLRSDVKRLPSFGLGCVAGAAGLARVNDYLVGHPGEVGVLLSVELCSLTLQHGDDRTANLVASGIFGDGATAVVLVGDDLPDPGPRIVDTRSSFYPDTAEVIGLNIGETGLEVVLKAGVADLIEQNFPAEISGFLSDNGLNIADVTTWIAHPGGPRVLEGFASALELPRSAFEKSWVTLARVGNLSSSAVLHVLSDVLDDGVAPGSVGLLFALGPGVSAEFVILEWP